MFWREQERESKELNGGPHCGYIRVLVVGDSGVGKTSLVHLIIKGSSITRPPQTVGCTVSVKHTTYGSSGSSSSGIQGDADRDFFVELWDVSGHERYKDCRQTESLVADVMPVRSEGGSLFIKGRWAATVGSAIASVQYITHSKSPMYRNVIRSFQPRNDSSCVGFL